MHGLSPARAWADQACIGSKESARRHLQVAQQGGRAGIRTGDSGMCMCVGGIRRRTCVPIFSEDCDSQVGWRQTNRGWGCNRPRRRPARSGELVTQLRKAAGTQGDSRHAAKSGRDAWDVL